MAVNILPTSTEPLITKPSPYSMQVFTLNIIKKKPYTISYFKVYAQWTN